MPKFAVLVIASTLTEREIQLIDLWKKLIEKYKRIDSIDTFLLFNDETIAPQYIIDSDLHTITFKAKETFVPGILNKTLSAFQLLKNDYAIFFRTNLSSYINYSLLLEKFNEFSKPLPQYEYIYAGNYVRKYYLSGCGFFICKKTIDTYLTDNIIYTDIIDDVSIGKNITIKNPNFKFIFTSRVNIKHRLKSKRNIKSFFHFRLKNDDMQNDEIENYNFNFLLKN